MNRYAIAIHGGAGTILKENISDELEAEILAALTKIVADANAQLAAGATALDVVQQAVIELENNPFFNAGKGAVYTNDERHELDAAIMDGSDRRAGSVAGLHSSPNPILVARTVLEKSEHVFLAGDGAEQFAREQGLPQVDNHWFDTPHRYNQLMAVKNGTNDPTKVSLEEDLIEKKFGTVGAVALDLNGNLAAATSTGGMTNKAYGRVGDSPVIGAGTYADNRSCAISATGHGEAFIRYTVASDISARMLYAGLSLLQASETVVHDELAKINGSGGVIGIDYEGNIVMPFNSAGMYRAKAAEHILPIAAMFT